MQPLPTRYLIFSYLHIYTVKHCFNFFKYGYTPKDLTQFPHLFCHCHHRFFLCCKSPPSKHLLFLQNLPQPSSSSSLLNFFTNDSIFSPFFSSFFSSFSFSSALLAFGSPPPPPQSSLGAPSPRQAICLYRRTRLRIPCLHRRASPPKDPPPHGTAPRRWSPATLNSSLSSLPSPTSDTPDTSIDDDVISTVSHAGTKIEDDVNLCLWVYLSIEEGGLGFNFDERGGFERRRRNRAVMELRGEESVREGGEMREMLEKEEKDF